MAKNVKETAKDLVEGVKEGLQDSKQTISNNNDIFKIKLLEAGNEVINDKTKRKIIGNIIIAFGGSIFIFGIGIRFS